MSIPPIPNPTRPPLNPKEIDLLDKIIQKTKEKKIYWNKAKAGYSAQVSAGPSNLMKLEFLTSRDRENWTQFIVQTEEGTVLTVDGTVNAFLLRLVGLSDPGLVKTMELFALVTRLGEGSVERAINALEKL